MLIYQRAGDSEGIDFDKTDKLKECMICHYWFFKDKNFNFEKRICNGCHDISMMCYKLENSAIFKVEGLDCRCILLDLTYDEAFIL